MVIKSLTNKSRTCRSVSLNFSCILAAGILGIHFAVKLAEKGHLVTEKVKVQKIGLERIIEIRRVVRDFVDPIDELRFQWRDEDPENTQRVPGLRRKCNRGNA